VSQQQLEAERRPRSTVGVVIMLGMLVAVLWLLEGPR
jgi:hypothetical protein